MSLEKHESHSQIPGYGAPPRDPTRLVPDPGAAAALVEALARLTPAPELLGAGDSNDPNGTFLSDLALQTLPGGGHDFNLHVDHETGWAQI